jgi:broad specificity phosphatase PhoE
MLPRGAVLALALLALPVRVEASEALWALLKSGGQVVIMRHAATEPTPGDRDTMRLEDCSTQRNLSPSGRDEARRIGRAFKARGITVDDVRSSLWCRCLDTATLAFGMAKPWLPLNSFFRDRDREAGQTGAVRELVSRHRGGTLVLVTHQINITALTGLYPAEGEMIVLTPRDGNFTVAGGIKPSDVAAGQGGG